MRNGKHVISNGGFFYHHQDRGRPMNVYALGLRNLSGSALDYERCSNIDVHPNGLVEGYKFTNKAKIDFTLVDPGHEAG